MWFFKHVHLILNGWGLLGFVGLVVSNMFWSQYDDDLDGCCHFTTSRAFAHNWRSFAQTPLEQCPIPNTNRVTHITQLRYTGISTAEDGNPMIKTGQYPFEALAPRQEVDDGNIDGWHPNISGDSQFPVDFPLNSSRQSIHWIVVGEYPHFWWP